MASLEALFHQAGRACTKLHLGTRTLCLLQHYPYCSSSSSSSPEENGLLPSDPSAIRVVSYAPKPKNPNAENANVEYPTTNQSGTTTTAATRDFTPFGQGGDSISRPWSREDSRYLKDAPSIPIVSYGPKVAPLPEDKGAVQEEENVEGAKEMGEMIKGTVQEEKNVEGVKEKGEMINEALRTLGGGLKSQLEREASRLQQHMFARRQEANIPFPKLLPPEKKQPKVVYDLNEAIKHVKVTEKILECI